MSAKQNTPSRAPTATKNRVNPANPYCRYCAQQSPTVPLARISDLELGEVLNEICPPGMFGVPEAELSEWICPECTRVLEKTSEVATKVRQARQKIVDYTNGIPFRTAITGDVEVASTSRKRARTTEQVVAITATDEKKNRTTVVVSAPVKPKTSGPFLEDSPTTRLRERQQALRSRMKNRENSPSDEQEGSARVVRTVRAVFQPPAVNSGEEASEDHPQEQPIHEVVCVDELEIVFKAKPVDDKRVPDILTPAPSDEDESRTPSPCSSSGSSCSEPDLPMLLKDPSHLCEHCSLMFLTQQQLGWHLRTHTGRGSIRCRLCPRVLPKVSSFLEHQTREHPLLRRTYCILCNEYFRAGCRAAHDQLHMRTRMKYACSFCPLIFYNHKQQKRHRQQFHNDWKLMCRVAPKTEQN